MRCSVAFRTMLLFTARLYAMVDRTADSPVSKVDLGAVDVPAKTRCLIHLGMGLRSTYKANDRFVTHDYFQIKDSGVRIKSNPASEVEVYTGNRHLGWNEYPQYSSTDSRWNVCTLLHSIRNKS